jgi:hypothetical protein
MKRYFVLATAATVLATVLGLGLLSTEKTLNKPTLLDAIPQSPATLSVPESTSQRKIHVLPTYTVTPGSALSVNTRSNEPAQSSLANVGSTQNHNDSPKDTARPRLGMPYYAFGQNKSHAAK